MKRMAVVLFLAVLTGCTSMKVYDHTVNAREQFEKRNFNAAITECRAALQLEPNNLLANYTMGWAFMANQQLDAALDQFKKTLELGKDCKDDSYSPTLLVGMGDVYMEQRDYTNAIASYNAAIESINALKDYCKRVESELSGVPPFFDEKMQYKLGLCYYKLAQYDEALAHFKKVMESRNEADLPFWRNDPEGLIIAAKSFNYAKQYKEALLLYQQAAPLLEKMGSSEELEKVNVQISVLSKLSQKQP